MTEPPSYRLDYAIARAVERDGLPRQAVDLNGSGTTHVLYRDGRLVRSMLAADWLAQRGPLPTDPTQAQIDAAILARQQATQQALADAAQLRQQVLTIAQSAVGVRVDGLTTRQLQAVLAILLRKEGALNPDLTIRPLSDWVR